MNNSDNNKVVPVVVEDSRELGAVAGAATVDGDTYKDLKLFTEHHIDAAYYAKAALESGYAEVLPHIVNGEIVSFGVYLKR